MLEGVYSFLSEHMIDVPEDCMQINSSKLSSFGPSSFFDKDTEKDMGDELCELTDPRWKQVVNASQYVGRIFFENFDQEQQLSSPSLKQHSSRKAERYCATCILVAPQLVVTSKYALPNRRDHFDSIYAIFSIYGNPFTSHRYQLEEFKADDDFMFYKLKEKPLNTPLDQFLKISSVNMEDRDNLFLIGYPAFMDEECSSCISPDGRTMKERMKSYETKVAIRLDQKDQSSHVTNVHSFSQVENHEGLNQMTGTSGFGIFKLRDSEVNFVECCGIILYGNIAKRVDQTVQRICNEVQRIKDLSDRITPNTQYQLESPADLQFTASDQKLSDKKDALDEIERPNEMKIEKLVEPNSFKSVRYQVSKQESRPVLQNAKNLALMFDAILGNQSSCKPDENCTPLFNQRTTNYPLEFTTRIVSQKPSEPQKKEQDEDKDTSSKIYTHIEPFARAWRNNGDGQQYIQLMGHVTYGWNLELGAPWTEATGVTVSIKPVTDGTCFLHIESVSSHAVLEMKRKANLTTSHSTEKGISGDLGVEVCGGLSGALKLHSLTMGLEARGSTSGGTDKLPFFTSNYREDVQHLLTIGNVVKHEFQWNCQAPSHQELKLDLERKYSRTKNKTLGTLDLEPFDPNIERLSKTEFQKLLPEQKAQRFSDYVNFGVWRWDGQKVAFVFHVEHGFRHVEKKKKHLIGHNYKAKQVKLSAPTLEFPIELYS